MKQVTLMKLHSGITAIQAIKTLREASRSESIYPTPAIMGLRESKENVDRIRFNGETPTVKVEQPDVLSAAFEYRIVPDADHFHASSANFGSILVVDNYSNGAPERQGAELFIETSYDGVGMTPSGLLDTKEATRIAIDREAAERLYDFLGDWLGK